MRLPDDAVERILLSLEHAVEAAPEADGLGPRYATTTNEAGVRAGELAAALRDLHNRRKQDAWVVQKMLTKSADLPTGTWVRSLGRPLNR